MNILYDILNFIMPRYCPLCERRLLANESAICVECLSGLPRTNAHLMKENPIEKLFWTFFPIEHATSFFFYETIEAKRAVHQTKYYDNPHAGELIAKVISSEIMKSDFFDGIDLIIPIPLHWKRMLKRGYNQCDYIARGISSATGIPIDRGIIKRKVNNKTQTKLSPTQRKENVTDIFELSHQERIHGKHILLVDDIITTGSTTISCAQTLAQADDVKISVISMGYAGRRFMSIKS